jgi:parvulin-like peptidyl-prolyl isomerase
MKISYGQGVVTPEEVMKFLVLTGQTESVMVDVIKNKELMKKAEELKIEISEEELQKFADHFRTVQGLFSYEDTQRFLHHYGLTEDDFEEFCEHMLLTSAVKDRLANEKKIQEYFFHNQREFDKARISILRVNDEALAKELIVQVVDDGEDFHKLARIHSVDEATKYAGGYAGDISRNRLPQDIAAKVFSAKAGDVVGPFKIENQYALALVEDLIKAELTEEMKEVIKEKIVGEWASQLLGDGIRIIS